MGRSALAADKSGIYDWCVKDRVEAVAHRVLPSGTLTFLFSDIEGSTYRWETHREAMQQALQRHDSLVREAIETHHGAVFKTVGDAFYAAFATAPDAVEAAIACERALASENWDAVDGLRIRVAVHTGVADERDGDYFGPAVNRVARLLAIGHGGQILASGVTADLVQGLMPPQSTLHDLGAHRLKDLAYPEQVYQVLAPGLQREFPPLRSLAAFPNNLPLQLTSFVGRDEELAEIQRLLSKSRLVTIVGSGGVGKTRASLQVAADRLETYADGAWLIELAPLTDPELVATTVANTLNIPLAPTQPALDAIVADLRQRNSLLIFDNCEHLVSHAAAVVDAILRQCPDVTILATSREGLGIAGESVYRMPSLRVPDPEMTIDAASAAHYGAMTLFAERAAAVSNFTITDANAAIVADVCRRLDGIALAIELAAPRLKVLSVDELDKRLNDRFRVLTGGSRNVLPRQQTLRALIDWSYDLLSDAEKTLFRRLGIFVGGFTLDAMSAICTDERIEAWEAVDLLQSLVEKSLVVAEISDAEQRYGLLESTRQYALDRLARSGEDRAFGRRHARYFLQLAQRCDAEYATDAYEGWLARYTPELDNFRAVVDWSLGESGDVEIAALITGALTRLWRESSLENEGIRACEAAVKRLGDDRDADFTASLWLGLANLYSNLFLKTSRMEVAQRALRLYEARGDEIGVLDSLMQVGDTLRQLQRPQEALVPLRRALDLARRHNDRYRTASSLGRLALALFYLGEIDAARAVSEEARPIFQMLGRIHDVIILTLNLAELEAYTGNIERAVVLARELLAQTNTMNFGSQRSTLLCNLSGYLLALERFDECASVTRDAIRATRDRQEAVMLAVCLQRAAYIGLDFGHAADSVRLLAYVDAMLEALGTMREPIEQREYELLTRAFHEAIDDEQRAVLNDAGRTMSEAEALACAYAMLDTQASASA